ncbi:MarR family transcriptional regulator [Vagococcus coleopterorum]|uniref:MarR family transcriptional regulator n=1 Tax=Vagococcus coleopterorum TaxID=2714946 RepID=A0A6G8AL23_9ENTE|nr:MarR family transcriptional regulator [Vagococcus coleopterorum]QIL45758.1 MarR family transcriptional regulator [Vagococcus coleopterorum]
MEKPEDYLREVLLSFRDIHQETRGILNTAALEKDITIVQLHVANIIKTHPGITSVEVAKEMRLGKSTISGIISRMIDGGHVLKTPSDQDARSYGLTLTESGKEKVKATYDIYLKYLLPILDVPREDLAQLLTIHQQILTIIDEVKANGTF